MFHLHVNRGNDPNHHTLDTLEQCMAFLLERIAGPDSLDMSASSASQSTLIHQRHGNDMSLKRNMNGKAANRSTYHGEFIATCSCFRLPRRPVHKSGLLY